jgi:hypothetical protein
VLAKVGKGFGQRVGKGWQRLSTITHPPRPKAEENQGKTRPT